MIFRSLLTFGTVFGMFLLLAGCSPKPAAEPVTQMTPVPNSQAMPGVPPGMQRPPGAPGGPPRPPR
jgi:hypothetical protein